MECYWELGFGILLRFGIWDLEFGLPLRLFVVKIAKPMKQPYLIRKLAWMLTWCSRRREEADRAQVGTNPPPHVGGYGLGLALKLFVLSAAADSADLVVQHATVITIDTNHPRAQAF